MLNIFIFSSGRLLCTHYYRMHIVSLGRGYCKKVTRLSLSVNILLNNRSDLPIKCLNSGYTSNLIIYNMLAGITYSSGQQIWKVVLPHLSVRVSEVLCFTRSIFLLLSKKFGSEIHFKFWNAVHCFVLVVVVFGIPPVCHVQGNAFSIQWTQANVMVETWCQ